MKYSDILENLFLSLPLVSGHHAPGSQLYNLLKQVSRKEIEDLFSEKEPQRIDFKPFGELVFPYRSMGAVDSLNLFDLDELIIFSFYWKNRKGTEKLWMLALIWGFTPFYCGNVVMRSTVTNQILFILKY